MLDRVCSVCGVAENVEIETVTNVVPVPDEMFPVLLCAKHKKALQDRQLDITMDETGRLNFILKKNTA